MTIDTTTLPSIVAYEDGYLEAVFAEGRLTLHRSRLVRDHDAMMRPVAGVVARLGLTKVYETDWTDDGYTVGSSRTEVYE